MKKRFSRRLALLAVAVLTGHSMMQAAEEWNPQAAPEAMVTSGNVRFTVLTDRMIRIQWSDKAKFEDRATFAIVNRRLPVPAFTTTTEDGYLTLQTSALRLRYKVGSQPSASDQSPENLSIAFEMNGRQCLWYPGKVDALNLLGTHRTLDQQWGDNMRYKMEQGLLSRSGWAVIDESPRTTRGDGSTTFALEKNADGLTWWAQPVDPDATDWYFLGYGHDYKQCLGDFTRVAGRVPLPPKYIFGYWYSRYWAYSQAQFEQIISDVEQNDIPMDVLIMDMDWHKSGWTGWSWNKNLISDPAGLIRTMHAHGLKTALNLHPADGIGTHEDYYSAMKRDLGFTGSGTIPWAIEDYSFAKAFFKNIIRPHEREGVDFWWIDWQQHLLVGDELPLSETFWCNHTFFEDMQKNRPELRPVIYHRWGGLGNHRYPICFSGDAWAAWSTLGYQIYFTSTASNVCYDYWGHDLGGHQGGDNDPELLQRWLQFGVYTPIFRTHATNDSKLERRIWKYPNFEQLRETVRLRYRLFPYIYTAARETYETGVGMNRPLYYDYPEADEAYRFEDEYLFGNDMLVAPIYTPAVDGLSQRTIWLPEGEWWDATNHRLLRGGATFRGQFTTDQFPVYYRPGSVIVNYPVQRTVQTTPSEIVLLAVPGANGSGRFYEDEGTNQDYLTDKAANTYFRQTVAETSRQLVIEPRQGTYEGIPESRSWRVVFLGVMEQPAGVTVNGSPADASQISFDADSRQLTVTVPTTPCSQAITVSLEGCPQPQAEDCGDDREPNPGMPATGRAGYYVTGSAVPADTPQPLVLWDDGTYHYHGTLQPGDLYVINTSSIRISTRYYAPVQPDANIINDGIGYTSTNTTDNAAWTVLFPADNYRFVLNTTDHTLRGEILPQWYEAWIVGGCTEDNQGGWKLEAGKAMVQDETNPYVWTWMGELRAYEANDEAKRFKINGQYGWGPKVLHPYTQDASILRASKFMYNYGEDYKWNIGDDGYYRITVDLFHETIRGEYLGTEPPTGYSQMLEESTRVSVTGRTVRVWGYEPATVQLFSAAGQLCATRSGSDVSLQAPTRGVYVVSVSSPHTSFSRKVVVE